MASLTYAVGDVHGRFDLLMKAVEAIQDDAGDRDGRVIMLGDYVDRGPNSKEVIDFLMSAQKSADVVCLKGNHEDMMVSYAEGGLYDNDHWLETGGQTTLDSYGDQIPTEHLDWCRGLPLIVTDEHRIYVHAGLKPGFDLALQDHDTMMWIRERFLRAPASDFPDRRHIVHGHTVRWDGKPNPVEPELLAHRTNLDTAAFLTGVLTVGVFEDEKPGGPVALLRASVGEVRRVELCSQQKSA